MITNGRWNRFLYSSMTVEEAMSSHHFGGMRDGLLNVKMLPELFIDTQAFIY
jgi:hypothetical protein